jgi:hypothetical protein
VVLPLKAKCTDRPRSSRAKTGDPNGPMRVMDLTETQTAIAIAEKRHQFVHSQRHIALSAAPNADSPASDLSVRGRCRTSLTGLAGPGSVLAELFGSTWQPRIVDMQLVYSPRSLFVLGHRSSKREAGARMRLAEHCRTPRRVLRVAALTNRCLFLVRWSKILQRVGSAAKAHPCTLRSLEAVWRRLRLLCCRT